MDRRGVETEPPGGGRFDDAGDATRRTRLANERTLLAWWRTGLASFAVSIGAGRLVPAVAGGPQLLYTLDGILFAVLGIAIVVYGRVRAREVDDAVSRGEYRGADDRVLGAITVLAAVGGLALVVLIALGR